VEDDELIGATINGIRIVTLLGKGGMANVYQGYQEHLEREVALKILPPYFMSDTVFVDRFQREARSMAKLTHPNIVTIYDAGKQQQWLYIVMEYVRDGTLRQRMLSPMRISEVAHIFREIASALTYAHERGIIHRDVKPVNVLLDLSRPQQFPRAVLTDFGIAKVLESSAQITKTGAGVGTPEYMSPEQCKGIPIDYRIDIYALGVMLYEMLCGRPPFVATEFTAIAHSHVYDSVPSPVLFNPQISPKIQSVIMKALQKKPEQRYQSAVEMAAALDNAVQIGLDQSSTRSLTKTCPQCGNVNPSGMNFCAKCGMHLRGGPPPPPPLAAAIQLQPITCLNCGSVNPGTNRHCNSCGTRLATTICKSCGRPNASSLRFCAGCGQPLKSAP